MRLTLTFLFATAPMFMGCDMENMPLSDNSLASQCQYVAEVQTFNFDYSARYISSPCVNSPAGPYRYHREIIGSKADPVRQDLPSLSGLSGLKKIEAAGPIFLYFQNSDNRLAYVGSDGKEVGAVEILYEGQETQYTVRSFVDGWALGQGDEGFYFRVSTEVGDRILHVNSINRTSLINEGGNNSIIFSDDYFSPAVKLEFSEDGRIVSIKRFLSGAVAFSQDYFAKFGCVRPPSTPFRSLQSSRDGRIMVIFGDIAVQDECKPKSQSAIAPKILVLNQDGPVVRIDAVEQGALPWTSVKLSPDGKVVSVIGQEEIVLFSAASGAKIGAVAIPRFGYEAGQMQTLYSRYHYFFSGNNKFTLYDGDGHAFTIRKVGG